MIDFHISGDKKLAKNLEKLMWMGRIRPTRRLFLECAQLVKKTIEAEAPIGPTGNLVNSIVAKKFKDINPLMIEGSALSFVAVDRKIAPHAHLVEFGHAISRQRSRKARRRTGRRQRKKSYPKRQGSVPPVPFFRTGVKRATRAVSAKMQRGIDRIIKDTMKRMY